jgi:hypothetical protein
MKTKLKQTKDKGRVFKKEDPIYPYDIVCVAKTKNQIYIDSHGVVMPCCWVGIQLRRIYPDFYINGSTKSKEPGGSYLQQYWYSDFYKMIENEGGIAAFSLKYNTLDDILSNNFFMYELEELWGKEKCKFCASYCATNRNPSEYVIDKVGFKGG